MFPRRGYAEPGLDEALGGAVVIGLDGPAGSESGLTECGAGRGVAAAHLALDVDPRFAAYLLPGRVADTGQPESGDFA
jgi:hypothetical protein